MHDAWPKYTAAKEATTALNKAGFEAYVIGGAVRDMLLGRIPKDFDLVTNATPNQVAKIKLFKKSQYKDTAQAYGVSRVLVPIKDNRAHSRDIELEIATYRRDIEAHLGRKQTKVAFAHLEDDVSRRDFTINSMAFDPNTNQLVDLMGGLDDIKHQLIRFIGDPSTRIQEDPLRILRAIRLKNQLGFSYSPKTKQALMKAIRAGHLEQIAADRVKYELTLMITDRHRKFALKDLEEFKALDHLLPEVTRLKGVAQPPQIHAEGDVWHHTLLTMQYLPDIINPRLAWAAFLHDVGKADTVKPVSETGDRIRFSEHHAKGAKTAKAILKRLGLGKRFREEVAWMIHYHMAIDDLPNMRGGRAMHMMSHPAFADLLELHKADAHAAWSIGSDGKIDKGPANLRDIENIWTSFQQQKHKHPPSLKEDMGIDGKWLMENFNLSKGPQIGKILHQLEEMYLDGEIKSKTGAKKHAAALCKELVK